METNPLWYLIFWCILISIFIEFIGMVLWTSTRHLSKKVKEKMRGVVKWQKNTIG